MLVSYEEGTLNAEHVPVLFQNLIDSGLIFQLQGSYVRVAKELVETGLVTLSMDVDE